MVLVWLLCVCAWCGREGRRESVEECEERRLVRAWRRRKRNGDEANQSGRDASLDNEEGPVSVCVCLC